MGAFDVADGGRVPSPSKREAMEGILGDLDQRQRQDERSMYDMRGTATTVEVQGDSGSSSSDQATATALEVDWTLPGPASATYQIAATGYIVTSSSNGTATLAVDSIAKSFAFTSGGGSEGDSITDTKTGGDTVSLILAPTFTGGGTVGCRLNYSAIRVG